MSKKESSTWNIQLHVTMTSAGKIEFRLNELEMTVWGKQCGLFQRALLKDSGQILLRDKIGILGKGKS